MSNPLTSLKNSKDFLLNTLTNLEDSKLTDVLSFEVNCEKLAKFEDGCHGTEESSKIFEILHNNGFNDKPAVYWFEITSNHTAEEIRGEFNELRKNIGIRKIPAINKSYLKNSKILYVGKGKSNISGRMFLHFGYEPKFVHLQGLQLCHWNFSQALKGLTLRLNIVYMNEDCKEIISLFEYYLAKDINPILGKHR